MTIPPLELSKLVEDALSEDVGPGDVTTGAISSILPERAVGKITCEEDCLLAGIPFAVEVFRQLDSSVEFQVLKRDGETVKKGEDVLHLRCSSKALLTGERTALNFLMRLSGIATFTRRAVEKTGGKAKILDTRKTTPLFRLPEKYAVSVGGGVNHRFGLYSGILIKDNHKKLAGGVRKILDELKKTAPHNFRVEVEIDSEEELKEALQAGGFDALLLDNMTPEEIKKCLEMIPPGIFVEISGNVTLENIQGYLLEGVDGISMGMLTHSAPSVHFSMHVSPER